ncbi:MAG TPA: primosomal protein N' [Clostridiales bacterium]|nr:primosomal protein N' [Clostridiales bacterium]
MLIAKIALEKTTIVFDMLYSYVVPSDCGFIAKGMRVLVPFGRGNTQRQGIVFELCESDDTEELKYIEHILDEKAVLSDEMLLLSKWLAERTFCTLYEAAKAMLPTGLMFRSDGKRRVGDAKVKTAVLNVPDEEFDDIVPTLTEKQQSVMNVLRDMDAAAIKEICYFTGVGEDVVKRLAKKGLLTLVDEEIYRRPYIREVSPVRDEIVFTEEQNAAYTAFSDDMKKENGGAGLLFGVTGSGKTKVYMKLIDDCLDKGQSCILMVPEISLTPQALSIFYSRYGDTVAVVHSALSMGERLDEFKRIQSGEARLVIGTRSAVFSPVQNLKLIIIDEEQEHTYKSERSPRYDARQVANFRSAYNKGYTLLVSATPSIETYTIAKSGKYTLAKLENRYGSAVLPRVLTVDMSQKFELISNAISQEMAEALKENLDKGQQSLLLLNRRGFNTFIACTSCKHVVTCKNCSISLTYHSANNRLLCHYCGYSQTVPENCSECNEKTVRYSGFGTQRIEEELKMMLPDARILRMDADTTMAKFSHEKKLKQFHDGEYDILLGTQMVAKGLDFPNVTFVGVVSVDSQLYNDDYRSMEQTFALLMQVVGRSGRGEIKGTAMIQTIQPESDIIRLAAAQDYETYYDMEMAIRKTMIYPPYCDLCTISLSGKDERQVVEASKKWFDLLVEKNKGEYSDSGIIVLGPAPARILKMGNKYHYRLIIKCKNTTRFRDMIRAVVYDFAKVREYKDINVTIE